MYAVLQSGQQRTETAEAYYHRLDNAFLDLVAEAEEHDDVEAPSHNQVVTQFLAGLRPEYEPIIGILQVTEEHEGRAITLEGDCLKLAQNYSKRIEKNQASEPSAEGYIASGGTKRSAHLATGDGSGPARWMLAKFGADIWGPVGVTSIGGFRYVFGMTDYYSAYGWVVFMKSKDEAPRALLLVEALVLLDGPGIRKVAVLMAPAHMSSAKAANLGVDAGELLVAGIHARSQDVHAKCKCKLLVARIHARSQDGAGLGVCRRQNCKAMDTVRDAKSG
eukprot:jgi/Tetstr1/420547/TSEL_011637.t1